MTYAQNEIRAEFEAGLDSLELGSLERRMVRGCLDQALEKVGPIWTQKELEESLQIVVDRTIQAIREGRIEV